MFQCVAFFKNDGDSKYDDLLDHNMDEDTRAKSYKLTDDVFVLQVIADEAEGKFRPVVGGFQSGQLNANTRYVVQFRLVGEFLFKLVNHPSNPVLKVKVLQEQPTTVVITDDGFVPKIVKIDEGHSVRWSWSGLSIPHTIYEAEYCDPHSGLYRTSRE